MRISGNKSIVYLLIIMFITIGCITPEKKEAACRPFSEYDIYRDVTSEMMSIYDLYYAQGKQDEANQLFYDTFKSNFGWGIGEYRSPNDLWLKVIQYSDGSDGIFFVWVGDDWELGEDGAWHSPCGIFILNRFKRSEWVAVEVYQYQ